MSVATTRAGLIIIFVIGLICIGLGIFLEIYCFTVQMFIGGYNDVYSSLDTTNFFMSWAAMGTIPLVVGITLIYNTYQILIPLKENSFTPSRTCQHCGAIVGVDTTVCEKCKQQIADK